MLMPMFSRSQWLARQIRIRISNKTITPLIIEFRQLEEWVIGPKWLLPEATVYVTECFEKNIWYQHQQEEFGEFLMDLIIKENEIEILLYSRYSFVPLQSHDTVP